MNRIAAGSMRNTSRLGKLQVKNTLFFCCDIQEGFRTHIHAMPAVIGVGKLMSAASKTLQIPYVVTEQYPKGLGKTANFEVSEIDVSEAKVFDKSLFSMVIPGVTELITDDVKSVVLFGIEAHVCILQTTLDLLEKGIDVHILVDGTSSMKQFDRMTAFNRLRDVGAFLTTSQSILFQLVSDSTHPSFKAISSLVKQHSAQNYNPDLTSML